MIIIMPAKQANTRKKTAASAASKNKQATKKTGKTPAKSTAKKASSKTTEPTSKLPFLIGGLFFAALLIAIFLFMDNQGAFINEMIKSCLLGLFGKPCCLIPGILVGLGIYLIKTKNSHNFYKKSLFCFLALSDVSALFHLSTHSNQLIAITEAFDAGAGSVIGSFSQSVGGGVFGACIGVLFNFLFKRAVSYILLVIALLILISLISKISLWEVARGFIWGMVEDFRDVSAEDDYEKGYRAQKKAAQRVRKKRSALSEEFYFENEPLFPNDDYVSGAIDEAWSFTEEEMNREKAENDSRLEKERKIALESDAANFAKRSGKQKENAVIIPESAPEEDSEFYDNGLAEIFGDLAAQTDVDSVQSGEDAGEPSGSSEPPKEKAKALNEAEKANFQKELTESMEKPAIPYAPPSIDLLNRPRETSADSRQQMYETANKLIAILGDFNVKAKLLQVTQGPTVTRYEIQPSSGTKLSKIVGLADDIALNLAVPNVLVAPVPGKAAVGIEVPNREVASVSARELLESYEFKKSKSKLTVALGKDIGGRVVVGM